MIEILDKRTLAFVEFLNKNYGLEDKESVKLSILHGYDAVTDDESGGAGFAVYVPPMKVIMLPTDIPEQIANTDDEELKRDFVIHNLAHEYAHYLQEMGELDGWDNEETVEKIADDFADRAVKGFNEAEGGNE